jgi:hypothetical protein
MNNWSGKWIMDPEFKGLPIINTFHKQKELSDGTLHRTELKNRHMLIRKTFELKKVDASCYIKITADDYYKLYVNGQFVGQGPAPAYYTAYNYNEYDLHSFLRVGRNSIAVHIYYQGLVNRVWNSGDHRQGMMSYAEKIRAILAIKPVYDLEGFKQSFHRVFYDTTTRLFIDREFSKHSAVHSNALPLLFGLFYDAYPHEAVNLIKTKAHKCGVYMSYFILKSLASGAIPIMIEDLIGLKPGTPGWEKISFTPHVPERLENFCLEFSVKTGRIKVEKKNGKLYIEKPEHVELIESSN